MGKARLSTIDDRSHHDLSQFRLIALLTSSIPFLFNETYKYQPLALLYVYNLNFLGVDTLNYTLGYFFLLILPFILPGLGIVISRYLLKLVMKLGFLNETFLAYLN